nr:prepilin-type N-terminal cleavage/methylation domain-containing protein [Candidatus Levybacteria bacterium]
MMNNKLISKNIKGFTLIELLIVVAIIGVLATLLMANFIGVRQRARDVQRKSDLRQIQSALEIYRSDQGIYPLTGGFPACGSPLAYGTAPNQVTYMTKIPCDPLGGSYTYTSASGVSYTLYTCLENLNDSQKDTTDSCSSAFTVSFTVRNP